MSSCLRGLILALAACVGHAGCGKAVDSGTDDQSDDSGNGSPSDAGDSDGSGGDDGDDTDGGDEGGIDAGPAVSPTNPGDLIITEIHKDPNAVGDEAGEWFEIHNPTAKTFDLTGLVARDEGTPADRFDFPDDMVVVAPLGYVVLVREGDPAINGGVDGDVVYGGTQPPFELVNGADAVVIVNDQSAVELDRVIYNGTFPTGVGRAMSLDPDFYSLEGNDQATSWCDAPMTFGDGDFGSPGEDNPPCGQ